MRPLLVASAIAMVLVAGGCRMSNSPDNGAGNQSAKQATDWPEFVNNFIEASFKANPGFAVSQGRHEYDGQIADLSPAGMQRDVARLKTAIEIGRAHV